MSAPRSFQVLHLLAELLDHGLQFQTDVGQLDVVRLRAQRIGFAVELLRQEVELAPDRAAGIDQPARLRHMGDEPVELLADVGLGGDQDRLLMQAVGIEAGRGLEQRADLLGEPRLDRFRAAAGRGFGARGQRRDLVEPRRAIRRRALRPRAGASR